MIPGFLHRLRIGTNGCQKRSRKLDDAYLAKPAILIADYYQELATTRDYEGREILELLQNVADQAKDASSPRKSHY